MGSKDAAPHAPAQDAAARLARLLMVLAAALVAIMAVHITADVAAKYFLSAPIYGTIEIVANYYMVAIVYLPLAYASCDGDQIKVELFTRRLPAGYLARHDGAVDLLMAAFLALIAWQCTVEALAKTAIGETRETAIDLLTVWPSRWALPIGFGLATAYHIARAHGRLGLARR